MDRIVAVKASSLELENLGNSRPNCFILLYRLARDRPSIYLPYLQLSEGVLLHYKIIESSDVMVVKNI